MGPEFVLPPNPSSPSSDMADTSLGQGSAFYPQHLHQGDSLSPYLTNENPSVIGNDSGYVPTLTPELLYDLSTTQSLDNTSTHIEIIANTQQVLDNSTAHPPIGMTVLHMGNEYLDTVRPRTRNDSTESIDTIESNSSNEIFNSAYTDTVSSNDSVSFLIKPSTDSSDEETPQERVAAPETCCCNDGYMSYSSTEVLNESDEDSQEDLICLDTEELDTETKPMLPEDKNEVIVCINDDGDNGKNVTEFVPRPLSPIQENEVVTFAVKEVEPKFYTKITDNLVVADESFLFNSCTTLGELEFGKDGKRAVTMHNLHERSSFLDLTEISKVGRVCQKALVYLKDDITMGSLASLNTVVAKENNKDPFHSLSLISGGKRQSILKKPNYLKNLIALSMSVTLLFIAVGSVRNLQSSINHEGGVGVISLAFNFVGYVLGSMFSSCIVQSFQPRRCLIANLFPNLLYVAANLYPTMWVMLPISLVQGISLSIVSNAVSTYITHLAKGCAEKTKETFAEVSCRYFGIYCLMYISHLIIGNLIASLILQPPSGSSQLMNTTGILSNNTTTLENITTPSEDISSHLKKCGPNFCQHFDIGGAQFSVPMETKYLLFGAYMGCIVLALFIAVVFMEPLNKNLFKSTVSPLKKVKTQLCSLARFFIDLKFLLLLPLLMYSTMQFAFLSAEFVKGYITCALGIHMIGYTMICFGICSSISSYLCGLFTKYVGRIPFIVTASLKSVTNMPSEELLLKNPAFTLIPAILNLGSLVYMAQWQPTGESLLPFFIIMGIWGITDGFWTAQANSLMGVIFPDKFEDAYAGLRMTQGLSVAIAFGYSSVLCMMAKIYISFGICFLGLVGYLTMEGLLRWQQNKPTVLMKQTSV